MTRLRLYARRSAGAVIPDGYSDTWTSPSTVVGVNTDEPVRMVEMFGQLVIEVHPTASITAVTPDSAKVGSYVRDGLVQDPYYPYEPTVLPIVDPTQGNEELLAVISGTSSGARMAYTAALNVCPNLVDVRNPSNGPLPLDTEKSFLKTIRRSGIGPGAYSGYRHFDEHVMIHVVDEIPDEDFFPPSAVPTVGGAPKTIYLVSQANKGVLGPGYGYSGATLDSTQITLAECIADEYLPSDTMPFLGQYGEMYRTWTINPHLGTSFNGYSREPAIDYADTLLAMLAEGQDTPDWIFHRAVCIGLQQFGLYEQGYRAASGAGQWAGYWPLMFLAAMALYETDPTLLTKVMSYESNETMQQMWAEDYHVGNAVYDGTFNHGVQAGTFTPEDVGAPFFHLGFRWRPAEPNKKANSNNDGDYDLNSAGVANFPGMIACMSMFGVGALAGQMGDEIIAGASDYSTQRSAVVAYPHRQTTFTQEAFDNIYASGPNICKTRHQAFLADRVADGDLGIAAWTGRPEKATPHYLKSDRFYFPTPGTDFSVSWDLSELANTTLPILEYEIRYTVDFIQHFMVDTPGETGSQAGLNPNLDHYFSHRRRNSAGWSDWSTSMKRQWDPTDATYQDPDYPCTVRPSGTDNGTPACVVDSKLFVKVYPEVYELDYDHQREMETPYDYHHTLTYYIGSGYWTGLWTIAGTTKAAQRASSDISVAQSYRLTKDDLNTNHRGRVTVGGVTEYTSVVAIPDRVAPPTDYIIYAPTIDAGFELDYWELWASIQANSAQRTDNSQLLYPVIDTNNQLDADLDVMGSCIRGPKLQAQTKIRCDLSLGQGVSNLALSTGYSYHINYQVGRGMPDNGMDWITDGLFRLGTTLNGTNYKGGTTLPTTDQPFAAGALTTGSFTSQGSATPLWMFFGIPTSQGGSSGGEIAISGIVVRKTSATYPPP